MIQLADHKLILNADTTQFQIGGQKGGKHVHVNNLKSRNASVYSLNVKHQKQSVLLAYFIKYYAIISAGGYLAEPIFIIADKMCKKVKLYEVKGLGLQTGGTSFLVFCQTRTANSKLLNGYALIPFINEIKADNDAMSWSPSNWTEKLFR